MPDNDVTRLASRVRLILMDVDGVMTDGRILFVPMPNGSVVEAKVFDAQDGAAISIARRSGMKLGIISGRGSPAVSRRAEELKLHFCYQGLGRNKISALSEIAAGVEYPLDSFCFIGDDLQDIPILRRVGFPVAVANACPEAKACAAYVSRASGGNGAVREVIELILRSQGKWEAAIAEFLY